MGSGSNSISRLFSEAIMRAYFSLALAILLCVGGLSAKPLPPKLQPDKDGFEGRTGSKREKILKDAGGTAESEAAVARGLQWLAAQQAADGKWRLDGDFKDKGQANDTAGTALGLLPFLGAGMTHKNVKDHAYAKHIEKGLQWLGRKQDRNGDLGGGMYAHGLATIALAEAYGQSKDANLRRHAQLAINYIVRAQHEQGGWRYSPGQAGDTSVTGWQVTALITAKKAGLEVPAISLKKAQKFLDGMCDGQTEGYGYTSNAATPTNSAIGLLCRHHLQGWNDKNPRWTKGIDKNVVPNAAAAARNSYFAYYATQLMRLRGGDEWKTWNEKIRDELIKTQDKGNGPAAGSWSAPGDAFAQAGGRLMVTSFALLNLEVYYRVVPKKEKMKDDGEEK
jgi:hypothetical protein